MRIVIFQHSDDSPPGTLMEWLAENDHEPDLRLLHRGFGMPKLEDIDWLILLGGPMNVDQVELHPWLEKEKKFLKDAIARGKTCLGLCLGGQLLAQVLGAKVEPAKNWEFGWFPVSAEQNQEIHVFHWHQDVFELPPGAVRIAGNQATPNQAFRLGDRIVGTQFHPEANRAWVEACASDPDRPTKGRYVQTSDDVLKGLHHLSVARKWFFALLDELQSKTSRRSVND